MLELFDDQLETSNGAVQPVVSIPGTNRPFETSPEAAKELGSPIVPRGLTPSPQAVVPPYANPPTLPDSLQIMKYAAEPYNEGIAAVNSMADSGNMWDLMAGALEADEEWKQHLADTFGDGLKSVSHVEGPITSGGSWMATPAATVAIPAGSGITDDQKTSNVRNSSEKKSNVRRFGMNQPTDHTETIRPFSTFGDPSRMKSVLARLARGDLSAAEKAAISEEANRPRVKVSDLMDSTVRNGTEPVKSTVYGSNVLDELAEANRPPDAMAEYAKVQTSPLAPPPPQHLQAPPQTIRAPKRAGYTADDHHQRRRSVWRYEARSNAGRRALDAGRLWAAKRFGKR